MYAHFKKLDYFSTECIYSPNAYRGHARAYIKNLELQDPLSILNIIYSGECMGLKEGVKLPSKGTCARCGYISSQEVCKACVMLEGLNKGVPRLGVGKTSKVNKKMEELKLADNKDEDVANAEAAPISDEALPKKSSVLRETTLEW